jgi:hypothetical protein
MPGGSPEAFVHRFVRALESSDMATVRASLHPEVRAHVTNAEGGTDLVEGAEALGRRFPYFASMADSFRAIVTQVHDMDARTVLFMVEIRAERLGRSLHNFAGIFLRLSASGAVTEYRMVVARAAESARFWFHERMEETT